jgi:hypothetical protein
MRNNFFFLALALFFFFLYQRYFSWEENCIMSQRLLLVVRFNLSLLFLFMVLRKEFIEIFISNNKCCSRIPPWIALCECGLQLSPSCACVRWKWLMLWKWLIIISNNYCDVCFLSLSLRLHDNISFLVLGSRFFSMTLAIPLIPFYFVFSEDLLCRYRHLLKNVSQNNKRINSSSMFNLLLHIKIRFIAQLSTFPRIHQSCRTLFN